MASRHLARQVATQIADYLRNGYTTAGIIGVAASPSCGVCTRLNITSAFEAMADLPVHSLTPERVNHDVVLACREPGEGLFIDALRRELDRRHLSVPFYEYDLILDMGQKPQHVLRQPHVP